MENTGARWLNGHRLRVARAPAATLTTGVMLAIGDAGLESTDGEPPADVVMVAVPAGQGHHAHAAIKATLEALEPVPAPEPELEVRAGA